MTNGTPSPRRERPGGEVARLVHPAPTGPEHAPPARQQSTSKHRLLIVALAALGLAALYGLAQWLLGPRVPVYVVTKGDVLQTIVASGRVETPLRVDIGSQITGTVAAIPVTEGQAVKAGELLIALQDSEAKALVAAARASVVQAQARLRQIRDVTLPAAEQALRRAQANLVNARRQHERVQELRSTGVVSQSELDVAQMNRELAESEVRSAQLQVQANEPEGSDYLVAATTLQQAQANLAAALAKVSYAHITAPADGTLIARDVERGDVVQPGKALMVLSPSGQTQLVVQIDEKNLAGLRVGQPALASADAYPDRQFPATVAYLNPSVDPDRGSVEVKLDVPDPPAYLRQDMTVSVDIEVARRANTLILAADAVHNSSGAGPWVMKISGGRAERDPVTLGARGSGKVEILEGLRAGDLVIASVNSKVTEGKRVRPVPLVDRATSAR
jgi:HlyD family secretion protein